MDGAAERPVDLAVALRWLGGDQVLLRELVGIFVDDSPKRLQAMRAAMTAADIRQLEHVAHSLKGSAAILGATRLQSAALALEDAAHDGHTENSPDLVARIARELEQVMAFFADPAWPEGLDIEAAP
ncbi:MAG TPA: Hpt domain-containing protein [Candidatus Binatia bacterium]|nr:Hpt domain-containing protein [Candidatus Binatia bacterium]